MTLPFRSCIVSTRFAFGRTSHIQIESCSTPTKWELCRLDNQSPSRLLEPTTSVSRANPSSLSTSGDSSNKKDHERIVVFEMFGLLWDKSSLPAMPWTSSMAVVPREGNAARRAPHWDEASSVYTTAVGLEKVLQNKLAHHLGW